MKNMMKSCEMEIAIARHFNPRMNLIVPNIYWGLGFNYELDLIIVTQNHYAWEIEIKTSISDLKAEKRKKHSAHYSDKIRRFYFAIPDYLEKVSMPLIPERAGLLIINKELKVMIVKSPKINKSARKLSETEIQKLYELAAMRIWALKEKLLTTPTRKARRIMSKYTPGPWKTNEGNFIVTEKDEHVVAEVPCQGCNDNDLPLIASAPELLEACKRAEKYLQKYRGQIFADGVLALNQCIEAIDKAEGQNENRK